MLRAFTGLAQAAASAIVEDTTPPSGPPTNASAYPYGGDLVGVQWTNGDTSASTQVGYNIDDLDPTSVTATVSPSLTTYETGTEDECFWSVRHIKNGQVTAWVRAPHENGCEEV